MLMHSPCPNVPISLLELLPSRNVPLYAKITNPIAIIIHLDILVKSDDFVSNRRTVTMALPRKNNRSTCSSLQKRLGLWQIWVFSNFCLTLLIRSSFVKFPLVFENFHHHVGEKVNNHIFYFSKFSILESLDKLTSIQQVVHYEMWCTLLSPLCILTPLISRPLLQQSAVKKAPSCTISFNNQLQDFLENVLF